MKWLSFDMQVPYLEFYKPSSPRGTKGDLLLGASSINDFLIVAHHHVMYRFGFDAFVTLCGNRYIFVAHAATLLTSPFSKFETFLSHKIFMQGYNFLPYSHVTCHKMKMDTCFDL